jgi:hypothetical protein
MLLPNHGGINTVPDVKEITRKRKFFSFQLESSIKMD